MRTFQEIKDNYRFTEAEMATLGSLLPVVEPHADQLVSDFYLLFQQMPDAAKFLQDNSRMTRLMAAHRTWLLGLFQGPFDERYYQRLQRIGHAHVRIGLSAHFVYVGMNFLRLQLEQIIDTEVEEQRREPVLRALQKILDLNLDIIARTYHEEEMRRVFLSYRLDNALIRFANRFTFGLNMLLLVGLIGLSLGVVAVLALDISMIFTGSPEKGLVSALGSLLILWLMIELLEAEVDRLQGGHFQLSLFVGVALVAFIRKVLVASLAHEPLQVELLYLAGILILGAIYWLVSRTEKRGS
ncbi:MAG: protoglobin domain-containing protein [Syntrophales bacterium]|nr:protoglobin domain-containing protein [Syntrophales bacterium]MDD5640740.1 protoglobin domain-containing protein [Syntrophales bacterium]